MIPTDFTSKLPGISTSIFAVMTKMANDYNAINLSQGFPDFNCSEELLDLVNYFMKEGNNQYAPMPGTIELRKQISIKVKSLYRNEYDFNTEITVTAGATQALFTAFTALINSGDEVIIFEPAYDSYIPAIKINGGVPVNIKLNENNFSIPWQKVRNAITKKTKCIVINSPHNPTGTILNDDDIKQLIEIVKDKNIFIISDEVYEHIVFNGLKHLSLSRYKELAEKSFIISSFGKTFHTTGWKIGYACAPEKLMNEFRKIHQFIVFAVNTPIQLAIAKFMQDSKNYLGLDKFYQGKRDLFAGLIKNSRFKLNNCNGTYFQLLDYSAISDKNDIDFCKSLVKDYGIAAIPLSPFYVESSDKKLIRICFAKRDEVLNQAADKLSRL